MRYSNCKNCDDEIYYDEDLIHWSHYDKSPNGKLFTPYCVSTNAVGLMEFSVATPQIHERIRFSRRSYSTTLEEIKSQALERYEKYNA